MALRHRVGKSYYHHISRMVWILSGVAVVVPLGKLNKIMPSVRIGVDSLIKRENCHTIEDSFSLDYSKETHC